MARSGARVKTPEPGSTKQRVVAAAIDTLKREGFAGTSAREIAKTGGFTQGVVFYHFGGMTDLLLAALDETSRLRLDRYRTAVDEVTSLPELVTVASQVFHEDLEAGHVKVLAELIAASSSIPELGPAIKKRIEPWIDFTQQAVERVTADSPLGALVPAREAGFGIVALYLGLELLMNLDGDMRPAEALFESAERLASLASPLFATSQQGDNHG